VLGEYIFPYIITLLAIIVFIGILAQPRIINYILIFFTTAKAKKYIRILARRIHAYKVMTKRIDGTIDFRLSMPTEYLLESIAFHLEELLEELKIKPGNFPKTAHKDEDP
jgi:hypothetical protein